MISKLLRSSLFYGFCLIVFFSCKKKESHAQQQPAPIPAPKPTASWNFETSAIWVDEFDSGSTPDTAHWSFEIGGNGWGNNELEYYADGANAIIDSGSLRIIAKKESFGGKNYTSARMISKGKGDWLYGRFEIRAKVPKGRGTWPAIWLLPTDEAYGGWPNSGEVDIMEHVGFDQNRIHFTVHNATYFAGNGVGADMVVPSATDSFHVYRCDWTPAGIRGYIDGKRYFEYENNGKGSPYWPYDKRFFMILNVAIGGGWGGQQGVDDSIFPVAMEIDYVRIYKWLP